MIIVETPLRTLEEEMRRLAAAEVGPNSHLFVLGARAALGWVMDGGKPPSQHSLLPQEVAYG